MGYPRYEPDSFVKGRWMSSVLVADTPMMIRKVDQWRRKLLYIDKKKPNMKRRVYLTRGHEFVNLSSPSLFFPALLAACVCFF